MEKVALIIFHNHIRSSARFQTKSNFEYVKWFRRECVEQSTAEGGRENMEKESKRESMAKERAREHGLKIICNGRGETYRSKFIQFV